MGTLLRTQVPVPMIPWVRILQVAVTMTIKQLHHVFNSPDQKNAWRAGRLLLLDRYVHSLMEPKPPSIIVVLNTPVFSNPLVCFFLIPLILVKTTQPAEGPDHNHWPPSVVLLLASWERFLIQKAFYSRSWQPTLTTLWVETPQMPQQFRVNILMSTPSFMIYCLSGMDCNTVLSHF